MDPGGTGPGSRGSRRCRRRRPQRRRSRPGLCQLGQKRKGAGPSRRLPQWHLRIHRRRRPRRRCRRPRRSQCQATRRGPLGTRRQNPGSRLRRHRHPVRRKCHLSLCRMARLMRTGDQSCTGTPCCQSSHRRRRPRRRCRRPRRSPCQSTRWGQVGRCRCCPRSHRRRHRHPCHRIFHPSLCRLGRRCSRSDQCRNSPLLSPTIRHRPHLVRTC